MSDKYETLETLKGNKVLNIQDWLRKQDDDLHHFKQQFNDQTATDEKFFKSKELAIREQKALVETWLKELGLKNAFIGNYEITLVVRQGEGA